MVDKQDNDDCFSFEVVGSVEQRVCVDDRMKSVDSVSEALRLVQCLKDLFRAGSFRLSKCLSSKIRTAIPECDRADLDTKHVLGVAWNYADDTFKIDIALRE